MKNMYLVLVSLLLMIVVGALNNSIDVSAKNIKKDGWWRETGKITKVKYSKNKFTYYDELYCGKKGYYEAPGVDYKKGKKTFKVSKKCKCVIYFFESGKTKKMKPKKFVKNIKKYANLDGGLFMFRVRNKKIVEMAINVYG